MTDQSPIGNSFRRAVLSGKPRKLVVKEKRGRHKSSGAPDKEALDAGLIPRAEKRLCDHRERDRHRLTDETATVRFRKKSYTVDVINLSSGGAMIRASFSPRLWDLIELELGDGPGIECAVRWLRDGLIGLEFAHETRIDCDPETKARLLLDVIHRSFPDLAVELEPLDEPEEKPQPAANGKEELGNRTEIRHPLVWSGQILYQFESNPARLRNISTGGALVDVPVDYPVGAEVMFDLGEAGHIDSVVSWVAGGQAGLKFKRPFDLDDLAKLRPDLTPYRWVKPAFLEQDARESTPWDEEWSRMSVEELQTKLEGFLKR
jgi:hypothetical protein